MCIRDRDEAVDAPKAEASNMAFPIKQFDTHAMSPQGVEIITEGENVLIRTSTTAKVWNGESLIAVSYTHLTNY